MVNKFAHEPSASNEPALGCKGHEIAAFFGTSTPSEGVARIRQTLNLDIGLDKILTSDQERNDIVKAEMKSGNIPYSPRQTSWKDMEDIIFAMRHSIGSQRPDLRV